MNQSTTHSTLKESSTTKSIENANTTSYNMGAVAGCVRRARARV